MKFPSLLAKDVNYSSIRWHDSETMPGVRFAVRSMSLHQRIELNQRVRELMGKHEFLRAGDIEDQLEAALSELLVMRLYLEWGLVKVEGLRIDSEAGSAALVIEKGPEALSAEMARVIQSESALTDEERKNS